MRSCQYNELFCKNVLIAAQQFLHKHMFTLQLLPKCSDILSARLCQVNNNQNGATQEALAGSNQDTTTQRSFDNEEPVVANVVALQEKMEALQVQCEQLKQFLTNAINGGEAEEAALLQRAIGECKDEIRKLKLVMHQ